MTTVASEIVALDEKGRSSFQLLQDYKSSEQRVPLVYYVFELLFADGKDLRKEPLSTRRKLLVDILKKSPSKYPAIHTYTSAGLFGRDDTNWRT
jgi:bifunctional non-homologous end joining protein LigD